MLSSRDFQSAAGSILLFATNFLCIQVMGIFTMYLYKINLKSKKHAARLTRVAFLVCAAALGVVAVPLYFSSQRLSAEADAKACLEDFVNEWGEPRGWRADVVVARAKGDQLWASVTIIGPPPFPDIDDLNGAQVSEACPKVTAVEVGFVPVKFIEL